MSSKLIVFEEHSWKYLFYARYNLKDYQTITKIGEIGTGGNSFLWENSKVLDALGNPISKKANAYGIPLAGSGMLSFKSLDDQQFGIPWEFKRYSIEPGYIYYPLLSVNKNVSLSSAQCEAIFTFEGVIGNWLGRPSNGSFFYISSPRLSLNSYASFFLLDIDNPFLNVVYYMGCIHIYVFHPYLLIPGLLRESFLCPSLSPYQNGKIYRSGYLI